MVAALRCIYRDTDANSCCFAKLKLKLVHLNLAIVVNCIWFFSLPLHMQLLLSLLPFRLSLVQVNIMREESKCFFKSKEQQKQVN